jgi:hypothetical protein
MKTSKLGSNINTTQNYEPVTEKKRESSHYSVFVRLGKEHIVDRLKHKLVASRERKKVQPHLKNLARNHIDRFINEEKINISTYDSLHKLANTENDITDKELEKAVAEVEKNAEEEVSSEKQKAAMERLMKSDFYNKLEPQMQLELKQVAKKIFLRPQVHKVMKDRGISAVEAAAIALYTTPKGGGESGINQQLRKKDKHKEEPEPGTEDLVKLIESGMKKLPVPSCGTTYRATNLRTVTAEYEKGKKVKEIGFLSTALNNNSIYFDDTDSRMEIFPSESTKRRDISIFSDKPQEQEIIYPPGTSFEVCVNKKVDDPNHHMGNFTFLVLQEI